MGIVVGFYGQPGQVCGSGQNAETDSWLSSDVSHSSNDISDFL